MNRQNEKIVITLETFQRTVIRSARKTLVAHCVCCGEQRLMIDPIVAASILKTTVREIFRSAETGKIHFFETESGEFLICRNSLDSK